MGKNFKLSHATKAFIAGSSLPAVAVTLTYMGLGFHSSKHVGVDHYELVPFLAGGVLGTANIINVWLQREKKIDSLMSSALTGALAGLFLSVKGHEGLDLPTRIFNIPKESQYKVHIGAPILYAGIFALIVRHLNTAVGA